MTSLEHYRFTTTRNEWLNIEPTIRQDFWDAMDKTAQTGRLPLSRLFELSGNTVDLPIDFVIEVASEDKAQFSGFISKYSAQPCTGIPVGAKMTAGSDCTGADSL